MAIDHQCRILRRELQKHPQPVLLMNSPDILDDETRGELVRIQQTVLTVLAVLRRRSPFSQPAGDQP